MPAPPSASMRGKPLGPMGSGLASAAPPRMDTATMPVSPCVSSPARASARIGTSGRTPTRASTSLGLPGTRPSMVTWPMGMPLNSTLLPCRKPATEPL